MREADIERYLVQRVKALGGEVRKVVWPGRRNAPDRVVMLPGIFDGRVTIPNTIWVEFKHPDTGHLFPMNPHERAQHREHQRMRACGQRVEVIWTTQQVDELLS